jgi:hypothetical protein
MATDYTEFFKELRPDMPQCPDDVLLNAVRNAAIEFCERTQIVVVQHDPVSSVADQGTYSFAPPTDTEVCSIEQAYYDGSPLTPKTIAELAKLFSDWRSETGTPSYITQINETEFILVPIPVDPVIDGIQLLVTVKPTRDSEDADDVLFKKYLDGIVAGAKKRLFAMRGRPWSDAGLATYNENAFNRFVQSARNRKLLASGQGGGVVAPRALA